MKPKADYFWFTNDFTVAKFNWNLWKKRDKTSYKSCNFQSKKAFKHKIWTLIFQYQMTLWCQTSLLQARWKGSGLLKLFFSDRKKIEFWWAFKMKFIFKSFVFFSRTSRWQKIFFSVTRSNILRRKETWKWKMKFKAFEWHPVEILKLTLAGSQARLLISARSQDKI